MIKQDFMEQRRARWERLEHVLRRLETGRSGKIEQHELDEFVHLYRIACSDLARARSQDLGDDVEAYLNTIVARGHKQFRPRTSPDRRHFFDFFTRDFPSAVRAQKGYVLAATLLFVVPIVITAWAVVNDPDVAYSLSDPAQLEMLTDAYAEGHQGGRSEGEDSLMTGFYVHNNVGIAFRCFATGAFFSTNWAMATDLVVKGEEARYLGLTNLATAGGAALARLIGPMIDFFNASRPGLGYEVMLLASFIYFLVGSGLLLKIKVR